MKFKNRRKTTKRYDRGGASCFHFGGRVLEALSCPVSTKFFGCTDLKYTTSPAIAKYMLLKAGVLVIRVLKHLSELSFGTNCPSVFVSVCLMALMKFLEEKGIFNFFFSGCDRHSLWLASVCMTACGDSQCV